LIAAKTKQGQPGIKAINRHKKLEIYYRLLSQVSKNQCVIHRHRFNNSFALFIVDE
jgi:hypothetical protein